MDLDKKSAGYTVLERQAAGERETYQSLLQQDKELRVIRNSRANNIQLMDVAEVPKAPYVPDHRRDLLMSVVLGLALAVGLAFGIEYLDDTVKTPDDVTRRLNMPLLGLGMHSHHEYEMRAFVATVARSMVMLVFITLGANLPWRSLADHLLPSLAVLVALLFVARPLTVFACLLSDRRGGWSREEIVFLSWTRETGVVPAALAGIIVAMRVPHADLVVAYLAAGPQSVISHQSALTLYDLSDALPGAIHLTVPRTSSRRRAGVRLHTRRLSPDEVTQRAGLPVTTVARTIADLIAAHAPDEQIRQAIREELSANNLKAARLLGLHQNNCPCRPV
jgi:hypothetical protein